MTTLEITPSLDLGFEIERNESKVNFLDKPIDWLEHKFGLLHGIEVNSWTYREFGDSFDL